MTNIEKYNEHTFDEIKQINSFGAEFWSARDLQKVLEYQSWDKFKNILQKATTACKASKQAVDNHFFQVGKTINMPKGATREIEDIVLSRYACYLIVQNGDSRKEVIARGQTYFALQTRKQELSEEFAQLDEDRKRVAIRNELIEHNKQLVDAAKDAGVETSQEYAIFQNHGYKGLYGGLTAKEIHKQKGLKKSHKILDFMGSTELAANLFRATQTEEKLRREGISRKDDANKAHHEVGATVRQTIKDLGGTMPEDLPTPEKSVVKIEKTDLKKLEE